MESAKVSLGDSLVFTDLLDPVPGASAPSAARPLERRRAGVAE